MGNNEKKEYRKQTGQGGPFIHVMQTSRQKYLYDVNTNEVFGISDELYEYFKEGRPLDESGRESLHRLKEQGYLKENRTRIVEHPLTELLEYYLNYKMSHLVLQVTQSCNLRCEYCVYSGAYHNRGHSEQRMPFEMAKKGIVYLIAHSRDSGRIGISFYGGEPLLAFDLIQDCVEYSKREAEGRRVDFHFTTNGTLLTEEKLPFLVENQFSILISLDGPEPIHDRHRKFAGSSKGSHQTVIQNIKRIRALYPEFYRSNIRFNTVLDPQNSFADVEQYMTGEELFRENRLLCNIISDMYVKRQSVYGEVFPAEYEYGICSHYLAMLEGCEEDHRFRMLQNYAGQIKRIAEMSQVGRQECLSERGHSGGPCLPGVRKLFLSADGFFYPCEQVSESSKASLLGSLESGLDLEKAGALLNLERYTPEMCRDCWAYRYCNICIARADDGERISASYIGRSCAFMRESVENDLLDYCTLRDLGYDFG